MRLLLVVSWMGAITGCAAFPAGPTHADPIHADVVLLHDAITSVENKVYVVQGAHCAQATMTNGSLVIHGFHERKDVEGCGLVLRSFAMTNAISLSDAQSTLVVVEPRTPTQLPSAVNASVTLENFTYDGAAFVNLSSGDFRYDLPGDRLNESIIVTTLGRIPVVVEERGFCI